MVDLFNWLQTQDIVFRVRHTPGCLNVIVDRLSRPNQPIPTEWSLNPEIVVSPPLPPTSVHVGEIIVHVSADSSAQQDNSEASGHPSSRSDTNGSLMAVTAMVPTPTSTLCGLPTIFPIPSRSTVSGEPGIYLGWKVVPSACMEALMRHYKAAGFSDEVSRLAEAPRRPSTNHMYDDRWLRFTHWAARKNMIRLIP